MVYQLVQNLSTSKSSKTCWYHFSVNHILNKITDISGKCFEDCSGKEKFERKYICWDAVLVPFHWRSHWSSKFLCPTFMSHQHSISFQMHVILASSRKALSCVRKTIVPSLSGVCRVVPNSCLAYALACPCMSYCNQHWFRRILCRWIQNEDKMLRE
jgi:hypothetical protein